MGLGHQCQGQKVKGQLVVDVLNSQHAGTGATWRINTKLLLCQNSTASWRINAKILSTYRGRRHIVSPRAQLVTFK